MLRVYKYVLNSVETQFMELPKGAKILKIEEQSGNGVLYAMVNPKETETVLYQVLKNVLKVADSQMAEVLVGSQLFVKAHSDNIVLYSVAEGNENETDYKDVLVHGTGHDIPEIASEYTYLDTVLMYHGALVFHVFYK